MTQAERAFAILRRRTLTYLELNQLGLSTCLWKRLEEEEHKLAPKERLDRSKDCKGRVVFRVVRVK